MWNCYRRSNYSGHHRRNERLRRLSESRALVWAALVFGYLADNWIYWIAPVIGALIAFWVFKSIETSKFYDKSTKNHF